MATSSIEDDFIASETILPVMGEKFRVSKKIKVGEMLIEKKLITKTRTIKVPITYEGIYVNGKLAKIVNEPEVLLSPETKDNLGGRYLDRQGGRTGTKNKNSKQGKQITKGENVPLVKGDARSAMEETIPLYGEQIIVSKKMVNFQNVVIKKRQVREKKKVTVALHSEQIKAKYPSGRTEKISS